MTESRKRQIILERSLAALVLLFAAAVPAAPLEEQPSILVITVDALRAENLGSYGYERETSPNIDRLLNSGLRFERAWTPEPLTGPAMCSMVTGLSPHQHAASRNGLRMQQGLNSLPKVLAGAGYTTAAFVGTWTLKDKLTRLGEHFDTYGERLKRRRWFGLINSEATCEDVTDDALDWLGEARKQGPRKPFFLWVHYIEPHAPYRFHEDYADRLGVNDGKRSRHDRYDTEIAAVDESIARLLAGVRQAVGERDLLVVFTADHGESLGEHDYWGHGRNLFDPALRIPLGITWKDRIPPATVASQANLIDVAPTVLGLVGIPVPEEFPGANWAATALGGKPVPERSLCYQAHRGAVYGGAHDSDKKRSKGLLSVGFIEGDRKEILELNSSTHLLFDLASDPGETRNLAAAPPNISDDLLACVGEVSESLGALDRLATQKLDPETVEQLRALGYLE